MSRSGVTQKMAPRLDRLLRSLVGVADLRLSWSSGDDLVGVHLLRAPVVQPHQLVRNAVSGLRAGFGIEVTPARVHVYDTVAELVAACGSPPATEGAQDAEPPVTRPATNASASRTDPCAADTAAGTNGSANGSARPQPSSGSTRADAGATHRRNGSNGNGVSSANGAANGNGVTNGNGNASGAGAGYRDGRAQDGSGLAARPRPLGPAGEVLRQITGPVERNGASVALESVEIERHGSTVRCRVSLRRDGRSYAAVAESPDGPMAEAELSARVALDVLRASGVAPVSLQGLTFVTIAGTSFAVASVRRTGNSAATAGTAAVGDRIAWSAAAAAVHAAAMTAPAHVSGSPPVGRLDPR
jgi:hypothetical protein